MHGLIEIDRVEDLDGITTAPQHSPALHQDGPLGIRHTIAGMHLHQVWFHEKSRFAAARTAYNENILISRIFRVGGLTHCQKLGHGENNVVVPVRFIHIRLDIFRGTPFRLTVFLTLTEFLCIFLGFYGAHKFYEGKVGMGVLYLFTAGLFLSGWITDIFILLGKPRYYNP